MARKTAWEKANTLRGFAECTADWLEEKLTVPMPTRMHYPQVDDETEGLVRILAALNRRVKIVTTRSQPGCAPLNGKYGGTMPYQCAALMGFVPEDAIGGVRRVLGNLGSIKVKLYVTDPGSLESIVRPGLVVVGKQSFGNRTIKFGDVMAEEEIKYYYGGTPRSDYPGLHPNVIKALQGCYQITVVDEVWGRNKLWEETLWQLT